MVTETGKGGYRREETCKCMEGEEVGGPRRDYIREDMKQDGGGHGSRSKCVHEDKGRLIATGRRAQIKRRKDNS